MLRTTLVLLAATTGIVAESQIEALRQDPSKRRVIDDAIKTLRDYYNFASVAEEKGDSRSADRRDEALAKFLAWAEKSRESIGVNILADTDSLVDLFDQGRIASLARTKIRPTTLDYVTVEGRGGARGLEYTVRVPRGYKTESKLPVVLTLHSRVINQNHPAFKGSAPRFLERGRAPITDYWLESPAVEEVLLLAPTGQATGFEFGARHFEDVITLMHGIGAALENYRVDWNRMFLEVQGTAMRVVCEYPSLFAGFIVRDGEVPPEHFCNFENLNGVPLIYIADEKRWSTLGQKLCEALTAAYEAAGAKDRLVVIRAQRDANEALKGDMERVAAFVRETQRVPPPRSFSWRFFRESMLHALPCEIGLANYDYAPGEPLAKTAGRLRMTVTREEDAEKKPFSKIDVSITEAESLSLFLDDRLVPLDEPVSLVVNGVTIHDRVLLKRDLNMFVGNLARRFFMLPYMAEVRAHFTLKPEHAPPPPPVPPVDDGGAKESEKPE
ncbi:MAG: hypothetical protein ACT4PV_04775 [Planctomycetaceae bacterium]